VDQPTPERIEGLLQDLHHEEAYRRKAAAEALGRLDASDERIARALEALAAGDPNPYVQNAARHALRAPANQPFARLEPMSNAGEPTGAVNLPTKLDWQAERRSARRVYWWLLLSPFVTVPCFAWQIMSIYPLPTLGERLSAAFVPLLFHIVLLVWLTDKRLFVKRHAQQAAMLVALRAGWAAISLNLAEDPSDGLACFALANGLLWLAGSAWGMGQVNAGNCWLMRRLGESDDLPRPWAVPTPAPAAETAAAASPVPGQGTQGVAPTAAPSGPPPGDPAAAFEQGRSLLNAGQRGEAVAAFLSAFRAGPLDLRRRAAAELENLGEVELF
jgi:hypothetical protein